MYSHVYIHWLSPSLETQLINRARCRPCDFSRSLGHSSLCLCRVLCFVPLSIRFSLFSSLSLTLSLSLSLSLVHACMQDEPQWSWWWRLHVGFGRAGEMFKMPSWGRKMQIRGRACTNTHEVSGCRIGVCISVAVIYFGLSK